jgi:hypothetical protein
MTKPVVVGCVFLVMSALGGCGARALSNGAGDDAPDAAGEIPAASVPPDVDGITGLHFTTTSAYPSNPPPTNVDVTLTDPTPARAIYAATLALPVPPPGVYNCPADGGYGHEIAFMGGQVVLVRAKLNSGGCGDVTISGAPPARRSNDAYWALVAKNLGVEESSLFSIAGQ